MENALQLLQLQPGELEVEAFLRPLGGRLGLVLLLLRGLLPAAAARLVLVVHGARCSRATVAFFSSCRGSLLRFGPELLLDVSSRYGDHRRLRIWKREIRALEPRARGTAT